jgi:AcrR family transcriptional regulator
MFAEIGYHKTGTVALVSRAQVTSGALYHHCRDKKALFEAVFLAVLVELREAAESKALRQSADLWGRSTNGFDNYLGIVAASAEFQRIVLVDGPAIFGWSRWRELVAEHVTSGIETTLLLLIEDRQIAPQPAAPLANLLQADRNEAALSIAHAADPKSVQGDVSQAFRSLLTGLRRTA